jgi:peptidoglycan/xylan/chitin deacetylase (PgdA/CDA1 family)
MKNISNLFYFTLFLGLSGICYSQNIASPYEVGTWSGFHNAAISYTFDDNCSNQLALAVPMFDSCGFQLTMFAVTSWGPNWTGLNNAVSHGHEVGNHTVSHADFSLSTVEQQAQEISTASNLINTNVTNQKCITMATPYCHPGKDSLLTQYFVAVRGCQGFIESSTPGNFMNVSSLMCGSSGGVKTERDFKDKADNAATARGWLVYLIHGIDSDGGYSSLSSGVLRASLQYLKTNNEKYWVTSFRNVAQYIRERNCLSLAEISNQDSSITLQVTDTLDNELYNFPVTIRRPLPQGWLSITATQNGLPINASIIQVDTIDYAMFDVVPDGGDIVLIKTNATGIEDHYQASIPDRYCLSQNYPNPFNPTTTIKYSVPTYPFSQNGEQGGFLTLKVYNLLGQEIATLFEGVRQPGNYEATFDGTKLASGIYFYKLQTTIFTSIKKMLLLK